MNDKDRIKLAEAMGWKRVTTREDFERGQPPRWQDPETGTKGNFFPNLPDPEHDANDDYAVLEWMRDDSRRMGFPRYVGALSDVMDNRIANSHSANYQIGDYARAALKVLEGGDEDGR